MIRLFTVYPERLNLNGDQGNLLVLQRRLQWLGFESRIVRLDNEHEIIKAGESMAEEAERAFLLVGHGSLAAMHSLTDQHVPIARLVQVAKASSVPTLVVGSFVEQLLSPKQGARKSEFDEVKVSFPAESDQQCQVIGYRNSASIFPSVHVENTVVYSLLHGPVLLKSPQLADAIISQITRSVHAPTAEMIRLAGLEAEAIAVARGERD